jgi:hypothetical protein
MGYILHEGALVQCLDAGKADPVTVNQHVKVSGQHIVTQSSTYTIKGCSLASSGTGTFCASAQWTKAATHVKAGGVPVVLDDSQATCINTGKGLKVISTQTRVKGT